MKREPIAVIGIGCRLPGAANVREFWNLLLEKREAIREVPSDRFNLDALYHPTPATPGRVMSRWGGFLDNIDGFDAQFFGVSPREADRLDPQQRLLLEVTAEALDDAGLLVEPRDGSRTAVFVGMWLNDYESRLFRDPRAIDFYMTTGSGRYSASGRLSYVFGFEGPSLTIDCACSSSLAAVHLACQSLRSGESNVAIAGGANVILEPHITIAYSQSRMMAPDGHCKFGDAAADGYVRSEGAAVVVLKPLAAAIADGDPIYALIRGSAVNNDGRSSGFLATPGRAGQETMLRRAYANAGVAPASVQYVEAHGTGTRAGDPVEIGALGEVLGKGRALGDACRVGSVKTNVGHTEGAAGVTGLIKVALAMKHGIVPASLHCHEPNPNIPWDEIGITVQREAGPWRQDAPAIAGVSAFGIAGTNAHVVLEQYSQGFAGAPADEDRARLFLLSAQSPAALMDLARSWRESVENSQAALQDVAYTAAVRRTHYDHRAVLVAATRSELAGQLDLLIKGDPSIPAPSHAPDAGRERKIVFVFPGQGSQWLGMGRHLLRREPEFRKAIEACDAAVRSETGWSVIAELEADATTSRLDQIDVIQPVLSSVQIALAALWRSWGFEPSAVVGHSMGEVAAACTAGALSIEDAARVICRRSRLLRRTSGKGVMAVVGLSFDKTAEAIAGMEERLSIAVSNSPRSTVISGDVQAVDSVIAELEKRDVFCRRVKVDVASHSPQMDPLRDDLFAGLQDIAPRAGSVAICSTVLASITDGAGFDAGYWVRNLRQPVLFSTAVQQLIADGHDTFIEMSPHPLLASSVQELLQDAGVAGIVVGSLRREEDESRSLATAIGSIWAGGGPVDFSRVCRKGQVISLPSYPWQRERHWLDVAAVRGGSFGQTLPLCGHRLSSPVPSYEAEFATAADTWLSATRVDGIALVPQAAGVAIASAAAREYFGSKACRLSQLDFQKVIQVPADSLTLQTVVTARGQDAASFAVHHLAGRGADGVQQWHVIASGEMHRGAAAAKGVAPPELLDRCKAHELAEDFYASLAARGVDVQGEARLVDEVWRSPAECVARLTPGPEAGRDVLAGQAALDVIASFDAHEGSVWTAERIEDAWFNGTLGNAAWCHVTVVANDRGGATGGAAWYDESGGLLAAWDAIELRRTSLADFAGSHLARTAGWTYDLTWEPLRSEAIPAPQLPSATWVFLGSEGAVGGVAESVRRAGGTIVFARSGDRFAKEGDGAFVIDVTRPAHYVQLLHEVELESAAPLAGIVHLLALDETHGPEFALGSRSRSLALSVLFAAQALEQIPGGRLWIVTRGAQSTDGIDAPAIDQAPCWGAARALALEAPGTFAGILDVGNGMEESAAIVRLLGGGQEERQVVRRLDVDYVPRLVAAPAGSPGPLRLHRDGSYLVTGGLGRLGLETAKWLAVKGAGHVVLVGRHGLPAPEGWDRLEAGSAAATQVRAVRDIEAMGTRVTAVAADTADARAMRELFGRFGHGLPRLRGIVHAAGRIDYRPLAEVTERDVDEVLHAKLQGTLVLHALTKSLEQPLDFFVMFSSGASVWGSRHLAHYAAANHVLDAIASARRAEGLPTLSINWGWWEGGSTTGASEALFAQAGLRPMPAFDALQVMGDLIAQGAGQRTVAAIDWTVFKPSLESIGSSLLARVEAVAPSTTVAAGRGALAAEIAALGAPESRARITEYICGQVGAVLGRDASQLETSRGFFKLGMDSLMTVELRRRLEAALDRTLPATIAFEYPTVSALAGYLCTILGKVDDATEPSSPGGGVTPTAVIDGLADRSEDELASMLDDELAHLLGEEGRAN